MVTSDAYGQRLAERMRVESAPAIVTRVLSKAEIAVTEVRCDDNPVPRMSSSIQREDAFLIGLHIRPCRKHHYWEDGRQAPVYDVHINLLV